MKELLKKYLDDLKLEYTEEQVNVLISYMELILERNEHINLTAVKDPKEFLIRHYVDSFAICNMEEYKQASLVMDLGTGAGFPGVPLAVLSPDKDFVLADSMNKRLLVINEFTSKLGITNVMTIHGRAEDLGQDKRYRQQFDLCVSRAVSRMSVLAEYCLPLVRMNGYFISYKGNDIEEELAEGKKAIKTLGGKTDRVVNFQYDELDHSIVVVKKTGFTPGKYPRRAGVPGKTPIR